MTLDHVDQRRRAEAFASLHEGPAFVIPNPWDAGTARLFTRMGFSALATTSCGLALVLGRPDGANEVTREETLANIGAIASATHLPVSADLESGFGAGPEDVADTIRLAAEAGAVGGSIEDATGDPSRPVAELDEAVRRVEAAVEAARALPFRFTLTARAENFLYGRPDLDDTIARLKAYEAAGADVLYAPGLPDLDAIRAVCAAVGRPVNVLAGSSSGVTVAQLAAAGARRISLGSSLARVAVSAAVAAARELAEHGTFGFSRGVLGYAEANALWTEDDG
ncbi:isocitrate lyase/PEP mutase family protein [Microtetraspora niveoalba]|uniref:isocitrate lyase/PEP mutase family protein n=1 Tax=Microtetraspora niveoalba TaxID=46175 RepID=UPI00082FE2C0|nr:isocitrate lyase/phosphoenolpyruvate mutase family protein [Microtetraspora niveoalba]